MHQECCLCIMGDTIVKCDPKGAIKIGSYVTTAGTVLWQ